MRKTIDLDPDLIDRINDLAIVSGQTFSEVISALVHNSFASTTHRHVRNGVPLFTPREGAVRPDLALVNSLRDEH
jgi:hypothetical protein